MSAILATATHDSWLVQWGELWADPTIPLLIMAMSFFVATSCALVGNYLVLRRISLVGDAISHSVLPGIVIAFMISSSRASWPMFVGALIAGLITTSVIELIHGRSRVKQDAAIGITFSTMFAIGVILVSAFAGHIDLDLDCVLYGKLEAVPAGAMSDVFGWQVPRRILVMGIVTFGVAALVLLFYKELLVSSFDPGLAASLGLNPGLVHYLLMCVLSIVVVSAFEAVGAVLVIAMLILPASTAYLLTDRLWLMMVLSVVHGLVSSVGGIHLSYVLEIPAAAAMVVIGGVIFVAVWFLSPGQGLISRWRQRGRELEIPAEILDAQEN
ncbi:MAG: manganese/zinc/iron transport system permease protein [Pseudoalteromonas tetraodonis]|jgi:manganese/zinc/iron transport system permease protein